MLSLSGKNAHFLKKADENCFNLIKNLWDAASNPQNLMQIRSNYGVEKISPVLTLKDPLAVRGATAILLYLAHFDPTDFKNDDFYENFYIAIDDQNNDSNYLWLARLLRILQVNEEFSDWILEKAPSLKDNKVWRRLYDISKDESMSDEIRKEASRASKEGLRVGAAPGVTCIVPEKVVERLKKEIIWKLTDDDIHELEELVRSVGSETDSVRSDNDSRNDRERDSPQSPSRSFASARSFHTSDTSHASTHTTPVYRDDTENFRLKQDLEDEIQREKAEVREVKTEIDRAQGELKYFQMQALDLQQRVDDLSSSELPKATTMDHTPLIKTIATLFTEVRTFKQQNLAKKEEIKKMQDEVNALKQDMSIIIRDSLEEMQTALTKAVLNAQPPPPPAQPPEGEGRRAASAVPTPAPIPQYAPQPLGLGVLPLPPGPQYLLPPQPLQPLGLGVLPLPPGPQQYLMSQTAPANYFNSQARGGGGGGGYGLQNQRAEYQPASAAVQPSAAAAAAVALGASCANTNPNAMSSLGVGGSGGANPGAGAGTGAGTGTSFPTYFPNTYTLHTPNVKPDDPLPPGWEKKLDVRTKRVYYFERGTRRTQWKPPQE